MSDIADPFASLAGKHIGGGCDDCNAYQQMRQEAPGVWALGVFHDDGCPWLADRETS